MFLDIFWNRMKINMRDKSALMWSLLFSLALGTLFYAAFHSIYASARHTTVPVALVDAPDGFEKQLNDLTYDDGTKLLKASSMERTKAERLLKQKKIDGIIDLSDMRDIKLVVAESGIRQSILTSVVGVFRQYSILMESLVRKYIAELPGNAKKEALLEQFLKDKLQKQVTERVDAVESKPLSGGNKDPYVAYFYSLIAMVCMMSSMAGLAVPVSCQANLSDVGARVNVSPVSKPVYELAGFLAALVVQTGIVMIGLVYFIYILRIDFGGRIPAIFLTAALGTLLANSLGFFVGHLGSISNKAKESILMTLIIGGGFLSGLMYLNMKMDIEKSVPLINRINPSSVITDAFYCLNMFPGSARYIRSIVYMVVMAAVFLVGGLLMSRRKSYASL